MYYDCFIFSGGINVQRNQEDINVDDELLELEQILTEQLEEQFSSLELLEFERKTISEPESLGKVIMDEIWDQLGQQVNLDLTKDTLVDDYYKTADGKSELERKQKAQAEFKQGKSKKKTEEAAIYEAEAVHVRRQKEFTNKREALKELQNKGQLKDGYAGTKFKKKDKFDLDHVRPVKGAHEHSRRKQAMMSTADVANMDENLVATNSNINRSKGDKLVEEYTDKAKMNQRKDDWQINYDKSIEKVDKKNITANEKKHLKQLEKEKLENKLAVDEDLMNEHGKNSKKAENKQINQQVVKNTAKKAGVNALKAISITAMHQLLKEIVQGFVQFLKSSAKSMNSFFSEMKQSIKRFFNNILTSIKSGAINAIGSIVTEILSPIVSHIRRIASFIKQGISSLIEVFSTWKNNKDKPLSVKIAEVGKVVTAGLTVAGGIGLIGVFEGVLLGVPGLQLPIPGFGTLASIISLFFSSLVAGLIGALLMYQINKFIGRKLNEEKQFEVINKHNEILTLQDMQTSIVDQQARKQRETTLLNIKENHQSAKEIMEESLHNIFDTNNNEEAAEETESSVLKELNEMNKELKNLL